MINKMLPLIHLFLINSEAFVLSPIKIRQNLSPSKQVFMKISSKQHSSITEAWVLIFNLGLDNEGVYTLDDDIVQSVLAFEYIGDAYIFAKDLVQQSFYLRQPVLWSYSFLTTFCNRNRYEFIFIKQCNSISPPNNNVMYTDREKLERILTDIPDDCDDEDCTPSDTKKIN